MYKTAETMSNKPAPGTQSAAFEMLMNSIGSLLSPVIQQLLNSDPALVHLKGWHGMTVLHRACIIGDYNSVLMFIEANSDVNAVTDFNETPLHYASKRGIPSVVHLLIQCGAKVDSKDNKGRSAVHHAAENGSVEVIKYFEETFGVNIRDLDNELQSPIHIVCANGHLDLFTFLMSKGRSDLRQADSAGNLPIHISSENGHCYITWSMLCILGTPVLRQTNKAGYTPLDLVLQNEKHGHKELAPVLKFYGNQQDSYQVSGPVYKWYTSLLFPLLLYMILVIISQNLSSYQFAVFLSPLALWIPHNKGYMNHRMEDVSRWPNPFYAGLFGAGILHTAFCYFWVLYPYFYTSWWITILSWTVCPTLLFVYYKLIKQDPGTVTSSAKDPSTGKSLMLVDLCMMHDPQYIYCSTCDVVTTKVTKHCKLCDQCYLHMDHHCLFLLKCVASNNHVLFLWLLILCAANMSFYCFGCCLYFHTLYPGIFYTDLFWNLIHKEAWPFSLLCMNAVSFVWTSSVVYQQYLVISKGCTSYFNDWKTMQYPLTTYQCMSNFLHFLFVLPLPYVNPKSVLLKNGVEASSSVKDVSPKVGSKKFSGAINIV